MARLTLLPQTGIEPDGTLRIVRWAEHESRDPTRSWLDVSLGPRPTAMAHTRATGQALVSNGKLGADIVRLAAGEGFAPHTHPGDHLLIVIGGQGTITYNGDIYPTRAGDIYFIEGSIPHAVGAITDHVILAVGSPHSPVDSQDRMQLVAYQAVAAQLGRLRCLICQRTAELPAYLHELECPHCPCDVCVLGSYHHRGE